jgi:hypothetical protein
MKQSTAAIVLLALVCGQAVQAGPIGAILTAPLAVVGGVANAAGQAAQAAVNTAAAVKKTVDDTVTDKVRWRPSMHVRSLSQRRQRLPCAARNILSTIPGSHAFACMLVLRIG